MASIAFAAFLALAVAIPTSAHDGDGGRVLVPGDHFQPGESITIIGSGIGGREVILRLVHGETSMDLGQAVVAEDGTFQAVATVPATFPLGYAELTATEDDGHAVSTIILIGDRAEGVDGTTASDDGAGSGGNVDARTIGLAVLGVGFVVVASAGWWYLRGRRPTAD